MKIALTLLLFSVFITHLNAQSAPSPNDDFFETPQNTPLNVNQTDGVLSNDISNNSNPITVTDFTIDSTTVLAGQLISIAEGDLQINADGSFIFTPDINFLGAFPNVSYTISNQDDSSTGNLELFVTNNEAPEAIRDFDTAEINTPLIVSAPGVLQNDSDFENNAIEVITFEIRGNTFTVGDTATFNEGSFQLRADGSFTFTPVAGFTGEVPRIEYTISDGLNTDSATLFLTTERITNLISYGDVSTCNQGYGKDGNYHIIYSIEFNNLSTARDYHPTNLIRQINPTIDLDGVFGSGCVVSVDNVFVGTEIVEDFINDPYPLEFSPTNINPEFLTGSSDQIFTTNSIQNAILYPRQSVQISFCMTINPFCGGRSNPTPSGSGIDFDAVFNIDSSIGSSTTSLNLPDFHTTESQIVASLDIPEISPDVNPDGTYDYTNTVIFTNEGNQPANNVNFNMGLGSFIDNSIVFNTLRITQVSGPPVTVNPNYNGETNTLLLAPNNSIAPGESVEIEIFHLIGAIGSSDDSFFRQLFISQSQGPIDGLDESTALFRRNFSYALWEDNLGRHVDRYYNAETLGRISVDEQCACSVASMSFSATSSNSVSKIISTTETSPNGILEQQAITFDIEVRNTSAILDLDNLQILENLQNICGSNIVSFDAPVIASSNATINPTLNPNFDGVNDTRVFNLNTGLLGSNQSITVRIRVIFSEDCIGINTVDFSGTDPLNNVNSAAASVDVIAFTDTDNDGISNATDIDDDNDGIPDTVESNGNNPTADDDNDFIPNYRDLNFGGDFNNDGIVDVFDFDSDGVPNHFDLDSDNDGIFDITEAGNSFLDNTNSGRTDGSVGFNGLDNSLEFDDSTSTTINYSIRDTDNDSLPDFNDIDADADGIVDNIESQPTFNYIPPNDAFNNSGLDTAYLSGIQPIDSDNDTLFDYIDSNADNDIRDDIIEGWDTDSDGVPEITAGGNDTDNDGLDDAFDRESTIINPSNGQNPLDFPNADYQITPELDWRELMAVVVIINNPSVTEGDTATFNIDLVTFNDNTIPVASLTPITINFNTTDGSFNLVDAFSSATSPFDYEPVVDNLITIPPFTSNTTFSVNTLEDNIFEREEFFSLNAEITSNNTITPEVIAIGSIIDNELPPTFSFEDSTVNEGEDLTYEIILSHPASSPVNFSISTTSGTALAVEDFETLSAETTIEGTVNPNLPNITNTFSTSTLLDNLNEPDEELLSVLVRANTTNVSNQTLVRLGTITDIDPNPLIVITNDTVTEGDPLAFTISLQNQNNEPMRNHEAIPIDMVTQNVTTGAFDYNAVSQLIVIPALTTEVTQTIETIDDNLNENTEQFNLIGTVQMVAVSNASNEIIGVGTIKDNDIPNLFSPNNDGLSDVFRIAGLEDFPNFKLQIMDRWGSRVYNYSNNGRTEVLWWDGTHNGRLVTEGVYYYTLDFNDGSTPIKMGFVQLVR